MRPWNLSLLVVLLVAFVGTAFAQYGNLRSPGNFATVVQMKYGGDYITSTNPITCATSATKYTDALKVEGASKLVFDVTWASGSTDSSPGHSATVQISPDGVLWATCVALTAEVGPTATQVLNESYTLTGATGVSKRITCVGVPPTNYVRLKLTAGDPAGAAGVKWYPIFCTYSYDGPAGDRRPVKVRQMTKDGVLIDSTNHIDVAGGATGYTDGIKIDDCMYVAFVMNMVSSTSGATTHSCKVQVSPDNSNWYDPIPEGADQYIYKTIGSWGATANTCKAFVVEGFFPTKYVRLHWTSEAAKDAVLGATYCITY